VGRQLGLLLVVKQDPALARRIELDLRRAFHDQGFEAICGDSAVAGLRLARSAKESGQRLALVIADNELEGSNGVALIRGARELFPDVRTILLVEHSGMGTASTTSSSSRYWRQTSS
jgi:ActR/RegA family two-component response regulator